MSKKKKRKSPSEIKPIAESHTKEKHQGEKQSVKRFPWGAYEVLKLIGTITGIAAFVWLVYWGTKPKLSVNVVQSSQNIFDADFIFKNEGNLDINITMVTIEHCMQIQEGTITNRRMLGDKKVGTLSTIFKPPFSRLGELEPGNSTTAKIVSDSRTQQAWNVIDLCFGIHYKSLYINRIATFGFYADKKINPYIWFPVPCGAKYDQNIKSESICFATEMDQNGSRVKALWHEKP